MLQKWKLILTNWINCYCKRDHEEVEINIGSLLAIISYLRKNLSLDDSRSSLLEAHTIEEFILEKYPGLKFDNGTSEPTSEEDLYLAASLLLYFVCVNSKNIDLKNAMCSKLSSYDQEIILKFSKCLMGCSNISSADVLTAIAEACGQDIAGVDAVSSNIIADTPPALRSLHSEVRRLQAALDAERFDRTYLQEELSRTNLKLEKLSKVKEQYKLEIVSLKAKVSECCGEENSTNGNETSHNNSIKLAKQLEQTEERLATVQEELSNAEYERNTYKNKLDDLKRDRDKYLALSQQENIRACQLAEELEVERRETNSLKELVTELRQHNHLNGFDTSLLECDDVDASLHSLQHNLSVCSEACANVIEVQLSEERAKIGAMKQQIQMLQDQLKDLGDKYENEQRTFSEIISDKESNILNLKHRINEEIERKNIMKSQYDNDITKLNNEINELEQILKDTTENSRKIIDTKLQEIQIVQEEKLSLLQSFSNETTKLNNVIQGLKSEVEAEKSSKHKMREDYDNHIMKLNEKVSNRSDELVKLQDKIVEKGEEIESLQLQLRTEKDMRQELINKHNNDALHYNNLIKELNYNAQQNSEQINTLKKQVQQYYQCVEEMNKERNDLNTTIVSLKEEIHNFTSEKQAWVLEREKIQFEFDEKNETVNSLKSQLQTEIEFKNEVQSKFYEVESLVESLTGKNADLEEILEKNNNEIKLLEDKVRMVKEEQEKNVKEFESERLKFINKEATMENEKLILDDKLSESVKCNNILQEKVQCLEIVLETERRHAEETINEKVSAYETILKDFNDLKKQNDITCDNKKKLNNDLSEKTAEVERLNIEKRNLDLVIQTTQKALEKTKLELNTTISSGVKNILETLMNEGINYDLVQKLKANDSGELQNNLDAIIETVIVLTKELSLLKNLEETLKQKNIDVEKLTDLVKQKDDKISQLQDEVNCLQQQYHTLKIEWSTKTEEYKRLLEGKAIEVEDLESRNKTLHSELNDVKIQLDTKIYSLKDKLIENETITDKLKTTYECQIDNLNVMVSKLTDYLREKANEIEALNKDKGRLEETIQDNNKVIKLLEEEIKSQKRNHEKLIGEFESERAVLKNVVSVTESVMEDQKLSLNNKIVEQVKLNETLKEQLSNLEEDIDKERSNAESELNDKLASLDAVVKELADIKQEKIILENSLRKLEMNLLEKTKQTESIIEEKNKLINTLERNKEELMSLEKQKLEYEAEKEEKYNYIQKLRGFNETVLQEKELLFKHLQEKEMLLKEEKNQRLSQLDEFHKLQQLQTEKLLLHTAVQEKESALKLLEEEIKNQKENHDKLANEFESERAVLKNMVTVTESVMEDQKSSLHNKFVEQMKQNEILKEQISRLEEQIKKEQTNAEISLNDKSNTLEAVRKELADIKGEKGRLEEIIKELERRLSEKTEETELITKETSNLMQNLESNKEEIILLEKQKLNYELEKQTQYNYIQELKGFHEKVSQEKELLFKHLQEKEVLLEEEKNQRLSQLDEIHKLQQLQAENVLLHTAVQEKESAIMLLKEEIRSQKDNHEKLVNKFESERSMVPNVPVTESMMQNQKLSLDNKTVERVKPNETLKEQFSNLEEEIDKERSNAESKLHDKLASLDSVVKELADVKQDKIILKENVKKMEGDLLEKTKQMETLMEQVTTLEEKIEKERTNADSKLTDKEVRVEAVGKKLADIKQEKVILEENLRRLEIRLSEMTEELESIVKEKNNMMNILENNKEELVLLEKQKRECEAEKQKLYENFHKLEGLQETILQEKLLLVKHLQDKDMLLEEHKNQCLSHLDEIHKLQQVQAENELEINAMKEHLNSVNIRNEEVSSNGKMQHINLVNKCDILQEYQTKAEEELTRRQEEIEILQEEIKTLHQELARVTNRDVLIEKLDTELKEVKNWCFDYQQEVEKLNAENDGLRERLNVAKADACSSKKDKFALADKENITPNYREEGEAKIREHQNQVHDSAFDSTATSTDSCKTINDLEKIIQDKNRIITALHSEITYLKTLVAESQNKLLDVKKDLDISEENTQQVSNQLKRVVHQKNEEISELKKQITKMCATETRATQIIKVSAKYQAMILKRIAEIKGNTVLKELTNFGNSNGDNEIRRSFNAGNITMEDLENFLETTDRHLRRCSEKQIAMQKERDRLLEVNKIHESEIISMRKFLTELSVSIKTFNSVKDLYCQKLNRVIALQKTVRRETLNLDGRIMDAAMCKLERGYAALMQDLAECALNLERWVDRSIIRSISPEKIKQAFISDADRASLVTTSFQNTSLEIQLGELESSFQRLLDEVKRAQTGDGAKDAQALTLMEVRAEYEDKLSRMKAKMKELYIDQITQFKNKQKEEIEELENKLQRANEKMQEASKAYQDHIRGLTTELWNVGEKFIIQKDEALWLRKQQKSGSLMSLQHVHTTGLAAPHDEPHRPSDTHSLRSLPVNTNKKDKKEGRGLHMSDEEGEVFDNRCLRELAETPRRVRAGAGGGAGAGGAGGGAGAGARLSELRWRNSLCPPHLKSSYPAETQFAPALQEEEIKWTGTMSLGGKQQRKEVGITAYKKPGPPTPSKQAGRLSATDSELRESLRVEAEPGARRTATPSRLFGLFRGKHDTVEGTPRSRRLSNIFRKK